MAHNCASALIAVVALCLSASSQVIELVNHDGRQVACERTGIMGSGNSCGTQNYDEIVVGTILSVEPASDRELSFALKPDEVFKGEPAPRIEVTTKQGDCFPDAHVGDRWLVFLVHDKESDTLTLAYGSGSGPVALEKESVERMERLSKLRGSGLIVGEVDKSNGRPRTHHPIVVRHLTDGVQYTAFTNKEGKFEFPPLPAGKYFLNPNTVPGFKATWSGEIAVESRQCTNYFVNIQVDGRISGYVRSADGTPAESIEVEAISVADADNAGGSAVTDGKGHYVIRGLDAGKYYVGLRIADDAAGNDALYAPGVKDRKKALTVSLGQAQRRAGVNIRVPSEP